MPNSASPPPPPAQNDTGDARRRLLELRLQQQRRTAAAESAGRVAVVRRPSPEWAPLSIAQQGLWFLDQLDGSSGGVYNSSAAVRLRGPLDKAALRQALVQLVERHESLRTCFVASNGTPTQSILPPELARELVRLDTAEFTPDENEAVDTGLARSLQASAAEPFDLSRAPLLRTRLVRLADDDHALLLVMHHIVSDGTSMAVLADDLGRFYSAGPDTPTMPSLPLQFGDHAAWQQQWLAGEAAAKQLAYWRRQLEGLAPLELPTDRPRPAQASYRGSTLGFEWPASLRDELKALALRGNATLFMLLLAAFKVLMLRYARQSDVAVGIPIAGRGHQDLERVVGYFVNTLVLRTDASGDPGFMTLLARVRETALEAYARPDLPFEFLVGELSPERDLSRHPLYQVSFALQSQAPAVFALRGLQTDGIDLSPGTAKFDLSLAMTDTGSSLKGALEYSTDLFDASTMAHLASHFRTLVEGILKHPTAPVSALPLLDSEERDHILVDFNRGDAKTTPPHACIHELIEQQVERSPDATAATHGTQILTYRELNDRANRVAHHLRGLGVGADTPVALFAERSLPTLAAVLGILKSGGTYVPLAADLPPRRLQFILGDCGAAVLLTQQAVRHRLPDTPARLLDIDTMALSAQPTANPAPLAGSEQLAYILYTSGSTGEPKGVQIPHRGLANQLTWFARAVSATPADRFLHKTSIGFDASLVELLAPLTRGATIVLAEQDGERDSAYIAQAVSQHGITILQMVPSALRALLAEPNLARQCGSLRYLVCGGEALDRGLAREVRRQLPHLTLGNFYGPTETSIDAAWHEVRDVAEGPGTVPIGRAIAHMRCHVLDARLQPVPVGVVGELCIGGPGLARGYLNQPAMTAERFVDDPFHPGERLYRSGDLARHLANGDIECLGRADDQVKLRGFRIDLGDVEAALNGAPGVRLAAALTVDGPDGFKRLVACLEADDTASDAVIRTHLRALLPEHMVPGVFVRMPSLPRLPSGKVDRRALPRPGPQGHQPEHVGPRSPMEEALVDIWREVLHLDAIGVHDNFFSLGGHSLVATQITSRVRSRLQVALPLRMLFEQPTIGELAQEITRLHQTEPQDALPMLTPFKPTPEVPRPPVSFSQRRMWLLQQLEPEGVAYNMPLSIRLKGALDRPALTAAFQALAQRHEAFRTTFAMGDDEPLPTFHGVPDIEIAFLDLESTHAPADREPAMLRFLSEQVRIPFDMAAGPLHRIFLVRLGEQDHALMVLMHHAVIDDWSFGLLLAELSTAYEAACAGEVPASEPEPIRFSDHAAWQRQTFGPDSLTHQLHFWQSQLKGLGPLSLPADRPAPVRRSSRGARVEQILSDALISDLKQFSATHGVTPFMTLLAAFQLLLSRCCGEEDIAVATPIANRTTVESEALVGTLVNTLVMRTDLSGDPRFDELLVRVRDTSLQAYAHQDIPYDYLVERLRGRTKEARLPDIHVMFNVLNAPWQPPRLKGLACSLISLERHATQFDLALHIDLEITRSATLSHSSDLVSDAMAQSLLHSYVGLLEQLLQEPEQALSTYRIGSRVDQARIDGWNHAAATTDDRSRTVHGEVARQAAAQPDAPAIRHLHDRLSHGELQLRVHRLARLLRQRGIGRGDLVGLCVERGTEMVVSQLAILAAGAAYVPLDPAYPADRLAYMAEDARLALLVAQAGTAAALNWPRARTVLLDIDETAIAAQESTAPPPDADRDARPEDPAYVIYTSGSTGRPKGVVVPHAAVVNFLASMAREPGLCASDKLLAVTTLSFDIAVLELLLPLVVGAEIILLDREQVVNGHALREALETSGATVMQATPSTWRLLIDTGWTGGPHLRALVGGEGLPQDLARQLLDRTGELWNMYGPTETTVWSTCWKVGPQDEGISIGLPIDNTQVHILDPRGRLCPIGVPGEIYIGGLGVTLGYLRRPELTEERFVPDPFRPGQRMYRTGDRGRWRHEGRLEHLGRLDFQVKVRGHRIELGEIESVLAQHPQVDRSVVVAREDSPGDVRLVAYVVAGTAMPSAQQLREHARTLLPEHMLPQHVVQLDAIPLLPNGKIDRSALPAPGNVQEDAGPAAQLGPVESLIADIWRLLLGPSLRVAPSDNFFDLGGHSLLAMKAVIEMEKRTGVRTDPRRLVYENLSQLAAGIGERATPAAKANPGPKGWLRRMVERLQPGLKK